MPLEIRPFKESDKPAIMEIAKYTWGGYDYLPSVLDDWIQDTNRHIFVMEFRNRVVTFATLKIIEDGRTGWFEGLRVRRWYRKRGYAKVMTQHLAKVAAKLGVERFRFTTASGNVATKRLVQRFGMEEILRLKVFWKWDLDRVRWSHDVVPTVPCTVKDVLSLQKVQPSILPKGILVYYWHALDATKTSIESLGAFAQFWKGEDTGSARSLSYGFEQTEPNSKQWCCTIYALDDEAFLSALSVQLQAAKAYGINDFMCLHPTQFQTGKKLPWMKQSSHKMALVLYEKLRPFKY